MGYLAAIFVTGIICATIYGLFELFARRKERMAFFEKLGEIKDIGKIDGKINLSIGRGSSFWTLRGAGLLLGMGLGMFFGCVFAQDLVQTTNESNYRVFNMVEMIYVGTILAGGGLGMLMSFIIETILSKKERE